MSLSLLLLGPGCYLRNLALALSLTHPSSLFISCPPQPLPQGLWPGVTFPSHISSHIIIPRPRVPI